jgi:oligosaccharide repeat unit polymerase
MIAAVSFLYIAVALWYLLRITRGRWTLNPGPLFVLQQLAFFLGMLPLLDTAIEADNVHLYMCFGALCMFIAGNVFCQIALPNARASGGFWAAPICRVETMRGFNVLIGSIISVSVVVCFAYYRAVGYNLFLKGLLSIITGRGQLNDVGTLRIHAYSGDEYFAPGYVNQFKNVLLPLLLSYLFARYILLRRRTDLFIVIALFPLCLVFLLGTGQRGAMFLACVTAVLFFMACLPKKKKRIVIATISVLLGASLLLSTFILGRTVSRVQSSEDVAALGREVVGRFSSDNQTSAVKGFRFVYEQPLHYGLSEWVYAFEGLIPGHERGERVGLANEMFRQTYGSTRGTSPPSIWGEAWYEFGIGGVLGLAFVLGVLYHAVYASLCRGEKTLGRLLTYAGLTQILGMWAVGGPEFLFIGGLITVLMLMMLIKASVKLSGSSGFVDVWIGGRSWFSLPQRRQRRIDLERQGSVYGVRRGEMR